MGEGEYALDLQCTAYALIFSGASEGRDIFAALCYAIFIIFMHNSRGLMRTRRLFVRGIELT